MLLYLCSAPVKHLLGNAMGQRLVLSGAISFWHAVTMHICNNATLRPTLEVSVSKQSGLVSS